MVSVARDMSLPHFQEEETEAQRGQLAGPRSHSSHVSEHRHHLLGGHQSMHGGGLSNTPQSCKDSGARTEM